ncbi:hypothetical protein [Streptomyces griseomycini]|uniref:Uncharacterized protein n=1 Tax=Streptomyces griseomycini TaxID=66895 RepID=A0A7W7V8G4_9ACTN|nr:hypothetical protein [Streptomyces griseomycini]MBB4901081.1 hypothetical protein [Streptomyces griseomycini]GGP88342.1 hypothetical protein GCM10010266_09410 [Streptomyces griseomycini]GGR16833.1 hypothetical protein GCM10015536_23000 [Streptomyces griseomycini]
MLAEEYGYQVSPHPAVDTPGMRAQVGRIRKAAHRGVLWVALFLLLKVLVLSAVFGTELLPFLAGPAACVLVAAWVLTTRLGPKRLLRILEANRWQVWPCRLEKVPGRSSERRVVLLAPDKSVAASFRGSVPTDVWLGTADGRGVLWFAGDLRFPAVAALPGGAPLWYLTPETPEQRAPEPQRGGDGGSVLDDLISEARSAVIWNMLN